MSKQTSLFIIFMILGLKIVLAAKECYKCSTVTDPKNCSDPFVASVNKCESTSDVPMNCIKYTYSLALPPDGVTQIYRGCRIASDTCEDIKKSLQEEEGKQVIDCCTCDTDLCTCNAGNTTELHFVVAAFLPLIFLIFNH